MARLALRVCMDMARNRNTLPFRLTCEADVVHLPPDPGAPDASLDRKFRREVIFNAKDEAIFELALRESFPSMRFMRFRGIHREEIAFEEALAPFGDLDVTWMLLPYGEPWWPDIWRAPSPFAGVELRERLTNMPGRYFCYRGTRWCCPPRGRPDIDWPFDWPILGDDMMMGAMWGQYPSRDPAANLIRAFHSKARRIVSRIATNRYASGSRRHDRLLGRNETKLKDTLRGREWIGYCALEWCRAGGDRRLIAGHYRPADDWEAPKNPWYRQLKAEVESRHGMEFGESPPSQTVRKSSR